MRHACLLVTLMMFAAVLPVFSQTDKATLTGTITDQSKGVIAGATVHIKSLATDMERSALTSDSGTFTISPLPIGRYEASVEAPGFEPLKIQAFSLEVGQTRTLNAALQLGSVSTEVSVVEASPALNMSSAEIGSVVKGSQVQDLPLNGRSWVRLLTLVPGAIDNGSGTEDQVRFAGLSQEDNNFHFDGVDATGINHQFEKVDLRLQLSTEAISEFRASSALFSANQGGSAGGQVEIVSRSGSNAFRGSAWEFLRNSFFDARPWNAAYLPALNLNNYGANFGGPVVKNKLFFFVNWESLRQVLSQPISGFVPNDAFRAQAAQKFPALATILNAYPKGNAPSKDSNALAWFGSGRNTVNEDSGLFRVDYTISDSTQLFVRFNTDHYSATFPNGIGLGTGGGLVSAFNSLNTPNAVVDLQHSFNPRLINDLKLGFNRAEYLEGGNNILPFGVAITGFATLSLPSSSNRNDNAYSIVDDATWVKGRHTIKAGVSFRRVQEDKASPNIDQANYTWTSESSFLNNLMNSDSFNGLVPETGQRQTVYSGYVLDEFKLRPNLTFNLGLRYDFFSVDHEQFGRGIVVDPYSCPALVCPAGSDWYFPSTKNFQPRVSIGWSPEVSHGKTVIRTGYGIFNGQGQFGHQGGPIGNITNKYTLDQTKAPGLSYPVTPYLSAASNSISYSAQDRYRKDLSVSEWSLSVQQEVLADTTAQIAYYGSEGSHLWTPTVVNVVNPLTKTRPYPTFSSLTYNTTNGVSNFHAMQLGLQRRMRSGLLVSASYQWSHAIDDGAVGGAEGNSPQNISCRSCERASSSFDVRQYFSSSALWQLPIGRGHHLLGNSNRMVNAFFGGWQLGMIGTAKTGLPLNVTISRPTNTLLDQNNANQRPNYVAGQPLYPANQSPSEWLNPAAFAAPANGTWGNAGRNLVRAPGLWQLDTSMQKRFPFTERAAVSIRAEAFNIFNRAQYGTPVVALSESATGAITNTNFGVIQNSYNSSPTGSGTPREIQLMLRLDF